MAMVRLGRQIRFSVNPFFDTDAPGANGYASKPCGEGLALFLELTVEIVGAVHPETGFVVNVTEIDRDTRALAVPVIAERIRTRYREARHMDLGMVGELLEAARERLAGQFGDARVDRLILKLNPYREITMEAREPGVLYFSEKYEFAAMHKLWNDSFSEAENFAVFGKCANPTGHGHNYVVEITVATRAGAAGFQVGRFQETVDAELIEVVDHKNLNEDVPAFGERIPTVENLAAFAWERLVGKFEASRLHSVTVWESDRTYCTYQG
jgi:6-pyruvoyltetrahydropterin/6-carboxytetrahydropterin synthase